METDRPQILKLFTGNWVYGVHNSLGDLTLLGKLTLRPRIDYDSRLGVEGRRLDKIIGGVLAPKGDKFLKILGGELPQLYGANGRSACISSTGCSICGRTSWKLD